MENRKQYQEIKKEDYQEPRCLLCDPQTGLPASGSQIPLQRIMEKLDEYCDRKDFAGAERHLKYWLEDARFNRDKRGEFSLRNEMMGYYRKQGRKDAACECAEAACALAEELGYQETESGATCYINAGTVFQNFGMPDKALSYFEKAEKIFEALKQPDLYKQGSLYNNMALAQVDVGAFRAAEDYYRKALRVMEQIPGGEAEQAITYLNMADALAIERGLGEAQPEIGGYLQKAEELLNAETLPRDGYYAFVCEKCAPGFYCYGLSAFAAELEARAETIYAGLRS